MEIGMSDLSWWRLARFAVVVLVEFFDLLDRS
jgi:hypothetical protein